MLNVKLALEINGRENVRRIFQTFYISTRFELEKFYYLTNFINKKIDLKQSNEQAR